MEMAVSNLKGNSGTLGAEVMEEIDKHTIFAIRDSYLTPLETSLIGGLLSIACPEPINYFEIFFAICSIGNFFRV